MQRRLRIVALIVILASVRGADAQRRSDGLVPASCGIETRQCPTGQYISKYQSADGRCTWQECDPLDCSNDAPVFEGCSGRRYKNACAANAAEDYCDFYIRLSGQDAVAASCPEACRNAPGGAGCPRRCRASDGTCACAPDTAATGQSPRQRPQESEASSAPFFLPSSSESPQSGGLGASMADVFTVNAPDAHTGATQPLASSMRDKLAATSASLWGGRSTEIATMLQEYEEDAQDQVKAMLGKVAKSTSDLNREDVLAVVERALRERLGLTRTDLRVMGLDRFQVARIFDDANERDVESIREENDGEAVETVLSIPGEGASPFLEVIGPKRALEFNHGNHTDFIRFHLAEISEIDRLGRPVQSFNIERILKAGPIATIASDVNLGTAKDPKQALEVLLAYPIADLDYGCPDSVAGAGIGRGSSSNSGGGGRGGGGGGAQAAGSGPGSEPALFMRVYLIGRDAVKINYLGDPVVLHPFSVKYTVEVERWPFCSDNNRLQLKVLYKHSGKEEGAGVAEIRDLGLPRRDVDAKDASYDALIAGAPEGAEGEWDAGEATPEEEAAFDDASESLAPAGINARVLSRVLEATRDMSKGVQTHLTSAITKLQSGRDTDLTLKELQSLQKVLKVAQRFMYEEAGKAFESELDALRREKQAVGTTLAWMRKRLETQRQTFNDGKLVRGFGHAQMFIPRKALVGGRRADVDIEIDDTLERNRLMLTVTFPHCDDKCIWDPTIEYTEEAVVVPERVTSAASTHGAGAILLAACLAAIAALALL